tara:strand:- start:461 stop:862 length:402 start_codon:yes stop_codon:yes gene_type:complete
MDEKFVVAWAVSKEPMGDDNCWIMVRHRDRGWELPGGSISSEEAEDEAALRELFEEAGVLGTAKAVEDGIIDGGYVVLIEVDEEPVPVSWESNDPSIDEVGWCFELPDGNAWGQEEIEKLKSHDWSTARILGS